MKCSNCKLRLFSCDVVDKEEEMIMRARLIRTISRTYRCPKCFKVEKVKI